MISPERLDEIINYLWQLRMWKNSRRVVMSLIVYCITNWKQCWFLTPKDVHWQNLATSEVRNRIKLNSVTVLRNKSFRSNYYLSRDLQQIVTYFRSKECRTLDSIWGWREYKIFVTNQMRPLGISSILSSYMTKWFYRDISIQGVHVGRRKGNYLVSVLSVYSIYDN